jgi:leucyl-tRNA synthetase
MLKRFDHSTIEKKWQDAWKEQGIYRTDADSKKPKSYVLDMFPYPSGEGLHVGHPKGYIATDVYSRFKKMNGFEVLHPMGWDAFGLPAENFAIKNKVHPRVAVEKNIANFKAQLAELGFNYDWSREINTTDPGFYKWTQWIFLRLLEKGLAYQSYEPINWCPQCQTGLANEDVNSDGTCERCDSPVEQRPMRQWVLKITAYADRMLKDLDLLSWPEHIKEAQRNWIGRSEGAELSFTLVSADGTPKDQVKVFTTRPDTLFGATYLVLAPEHPFVESQKADIENWDEVRAYRADASAKKDMERMAAGREKTGVELKGIAAINPATGATIPVYVADYVLAHYGTGAIMAVPAHDERDFAFAQKYGIAVVQVIEGEAALPFPGDEGVLMNSGDFSGMNAADAKRAITEAYEGTLTQTYRIKDWVFSRQRYWGEPIPVIHCESCGVVPVPDNELPVRLPDVEHYAPTGTGESPLAAIDEWVNVPCPKCGGKGKRETNTMPQWAGSSWYYLRFIDPANDTALIDPKMEQKWSPVDVYVGGDHAVRHLIYARFWHKFLYDLGVVTSEEPFSRLEFLGFILAEDGRKMSKRWGNIINPSTIVAQNGADTLRVYEMFMGPFENTIAWSTDGLVGAQRFLERVNGLSDHIAPASSEAFKVVLHTTIEKVTSDIENFKFNTAISALMICLNAAEKEGLTKDEYGVFLRLLAPFAPHLSEELWHAAGSTTFIHLESWPHADAALLNKRTVTMAVQVNGKVRGTVQVPFDALESEVMAKAEADPSIKAHLDKVAKNKVIFVQNKIINVLGPISGYGALDAE